MNGRVYDPTLGRFIQADPHIQAPSDSQSLNRYSYVKNNPLSYTDPTGFFFKKLFKGLKKLWNKIRPFVGTILNIIVAIKCFGVCTAGQWAIGAAEAGFMGAAATGGNPIKGALMGAFSSYAFGFIGANFDVGTFGNIVGNGVVGGIMSELQGGKFGHGFVSAGFAAAFKPMVNKIGNGAASHTAHRVIVAGLIGGTASRLSGGKFANGAITGAMSQALNGEKAQGKEHYYDVGATDDDLEICTLDSVCNVDTVAKFNRQSPHTGLLDSNVEVKTGDITTVEIGYDSFGGEWDELGPVVHTVSADGLTVTNTTMEGHVLHPGWVKRQVVLRGNKIYIRTTGGGTGAWARTNEALAAPLWTGAANNVIRMKVGRLYRYQHKIK